MNTALKTLACAAAIAAFAGAPIALAQQQRDQRQPQQPVRQQTPDRTQNRVPTTTAPVGTFDLKLDRSSELMGANVHGATGDKIGDIADFVVSRRTGQIDSVLINTGAILGVGVKEIRLPYHALAWNPAEDRLQTTMTKASIDAIPAFDRKTMKDLPLENLGGHDAMDRDMNRDPMKRDDMNRDDMNRDDANRNNPDRDSMTRDEVDEDQNRRTTTTGNQTGRDLNHADPYGADRGILLSTIVGRDLNCLNQACGEVEDTLVEVHTGRVLYLVIDPDENFLGVADTLRLAPFSIARWDAAAGDLQIDATKAQLLAAPEFSGDMTPFAARTRVTEVYRVYGQEAPVLDRRASDRMMNDRNMRDDTMRNNPSPTTPDRTAPRNTDRNPGTRSN
jgi:sporulation protein YlmC with PRC-barrel domain